MKQFKKIKLLNLSSEKNKEISYLLSGKLEAIEYKSVKYWINQCYNTPNYNEQLMEAFNEILEGYGVEAIEGKWKNGYWCNIVATYVNMGDSYINTIIHHRDKGFIIGCIGDLFTE